MFNGQSGRSEYGYSYGSADLSLTDCTLSGNSAESGGGVYNSGSANLVACTVSGNSGGGLVNASGPMSLTDTIVAGNTNSSGASDIGGQPQVTGSNNLIGTGGSGGLVNGVDGNIVGLANPLLAPLGNYGGPTQTMALLARQPRHRRGHRRCRRHRPITSAASRSTPPIRTSAPSRPRGSNSSS